MPEPQEQIITLRPYEGDQSIFTGATYIPLLSEDITSLNEQWTVQKLAEHSWDRIPKDLTDTRAAAGRGIEVLRQLGHNATLYYYEDEAGDKYIVLPGGEKTVLPSKEKIHGEA